MKFDFEDDSMKVLAFRGKKYISYKLGAILFDGLQNLARLLKPIYLSKTYRIFEVPEEFYDKLTKFKEIDLDSQVAELTKIEKADDSYSVIEVDKSKVFKFNDIEVIPNKAITNVKIWRFFEFPDLFPLIYVFKSRFIVLNRVNAHEGTNKKYRKYVFI